MRTLPFYGKERHRCCGNAAHRVMRYTKSTYPSISGKESVAKEVALSSSRMHELPLVELDVARSPGRTTEAIFCFLETGSELMLAQPRL